MSPRSLKKMSFSPYMRGIICGIALSGILLVHAALLAHASVDNAFAFQILERYAGNPAAPQYAVSPLALARDAQTIVRLHADAIHDRAPAFVGPKNWTIRCKVFAVSIAVAKSDTCGPVEHVTAQNASNAIARWSTSYIGASGAGLSEFDGGPSLVSVLASVGKYSGTFVYPPQSVVAGRIPLTFLLGNQANVLSNGTVPVLTSGDITGVQLGLLDGSKLYVFEGSSDQEIREIAETMAAAWDALKSRFRVRPAYVALERALNSVTYISSLPGADGSLPGIGGYGQLGFVQRSSIVTNGTTLTIAVEDTFASYPQQCCSDGGTPPPAAAASVNGYRPSVLVLEDARGQIDFIAGAN